MGYASAAAAASPFVRWHHLIVVSSPEQEQ
jgi:hypothetical protein